MDDKMMHLVMIAWQISRIHPNALLNIAAILAAPS